MKATRCCALILSLATGGYGSTVLSQTAPEAYTQRCAICHLPGIAGAPKVGDTAEWSRRVRSGLLGVYRNTLEGIPNTAMLANGGAPDLRADEIKTIVDYMLAAARLAPETLASAARYDRLGISNRDFIRLDANFDGVLTRNELAGDPVLLRNFARFDANADARLNVAEFERAEAQLELERKALRVDDRELASAVRTALARVRGVDLANAKIEVADGVVVIVGIVEEALTAIQAYDAIKRIPGVQRIDNRFVSGHQMGWD